MRYDQTDQTDDAGERNRCRRQQCGAEYNDETEPLHGNPERLCLLITKGEQIDAPAQEKERYEGSSHKQEREEEAVE